LGVDRIMNRARKLLVVLFVVAICGLVSHAVSSAALTDHGSALDVASSIYIGASWAPQVSITRGALRELRERMARYKYPTGICITGPMEDDCRAPDSIEEAWLLEKLYGPPQRWVFDVVPLAELQAPSVDAGERYSVTQVRGITVGILTSKTVSRLSIELHGDAIRVYELDA
jgi:hypothetical protein